MQPSRHSLGLSPARLAWLATPLAADRLLAVGGFAVDGGLLGSPSHVVELHCSSGGELRRLQRWRQPEDLCELAAAPLASGELLLLAASTSGAVTQARVKPPGDGEADALEFLDDDGSGALAALCALGGPGEVALDAEAGGNLAAAATSGGLLALLPLDGGACSPTRLVADGDACFAAVRFATRTTLLTVGGAPGLQVWDSRAGGTAAQALAWSPPGASGRAGALDVLPAAPHLVAVGSADLGAPAVALFDLRHSAAPLACGTPAGAGPVTAVRFDTSGEFTARTGSWLLAAAGGCVSAVARGGQSRELLRCEAAVRHCALEGNAALLAAATEGDALLVLDGLRGRSDDGL